LLIPITVLAVLFTTTVAIICGLAALLVNVEHLNLKIIFASLAASNAMSVGAILVTAFWPGVYQVTFPYMVVAWSVSKIAFITAAVLLVREIEHRDPD
jgi:hypothetical protein